MLQLLYTSISSGPLTPKLVDEICKQARRNNGRDEITGILVTKGLRFLQALEGPKSTVEDTFMRLIIDPRHHTVKVLRRRMITRREFGDWEMRHCAEVQDCPDVFSKIDFILEEAPEASKSDFADFVC